ncbi:MAG: hypothetical protein M3320_02605, partial [Actinomycetota bacterium]|nr:hypothetical protein [Actinomycetota bacterium]
MRVALTAVLLALALPATAAAAPVVTSDGTTVLVKDDSGASSVHTDVTNDEVRVTTGYGAEEGATLVAGTGCTQVAEAIVTCDLAGVVAVRLEMGGGDDYASTGDGDLRRELLGEEGADRLFDGTGDDFLDGGQGADELEMGWGDDEAHGGSERDVVSWSGRLDPIEAVLPDTGTTTGNGADGEDDVLHDDIENLRGGQGADRLVGNERANEIDGWLEGDELLGMAGADTLRDYQGADRFDGGPGDDFLDTADYWPDVAIDCGDGDDRLDADTLLSPEADPPPAGCETIAPEFIDGPDTLIADEFKVGHFIRPEDFSVTGDQDSEPPEVEVHWHRCDGHEIPRHCDLFVGPLVYGLQPADAGKVMYAIVTVRNAAGEAHWPTEDSPVIAPGPPPQPVDPTPQPPPPPPPEVVVLPPAGLVPPPPPDYRDYGDYADYLDPLSQLEDSVAGRLRGLTRRFTGKD